MIIDFVDTAKDSFPATVNDKFDPRIDRHIPQVLLLINSFEKRLNVTAVTKTSWVGASMTAYLTAQQIEQLSLDPMVRMLTEDYAVEYSAPPSPGPWYPAWNGAAWGELNDWARVAVNGKTVLPGSTRKIYIIDGGVAQHRDLDSASGLPGGVIARVNVDTPVSGGLYPVVGCYAHPTHVAGIVGARSGNGQVRAGIYAGVNIISVSGGNSQAEYSTAYNAYLYNCLPVNSFTAALVGAAFDYVKYQNIVSYGAPAPVHIVNQSMNNVGTGYNNNNTEETNRPKLMSMVTPGFVFSTYWNPAVVYVQSAGNKNINACDINQPADPTVAGYANSPAFKTSANATSTAANDGILVVGAINSSGDPVSNSTYPTIDPNGGFRKFSPSEPRAVSSTVPGSNYGSCVDIWAPGEKIYSTWGIGSSITSGSTIYAGGPPPTFFGGQPQNYVEGTAWNQVNPPYEGWAWLSGTSMAAPHVAAAAAYVADKYNLTTPGDIELKLRQNAQWYLNKLDPAGQPVKVVYLPD